MTFSMGELADADSNPDASLVSSWRPEGWPGGSYGYGLCTCDLAAAAVCDVLPENPYCLENARCPAGSRCLSAREIWGEICPITGPCVPIVDFDEGLCVPAEVEPETRR